jgi:L-asparaginase II
MLSSVPTEHSLAHLMTEAMQSVIVTAMGMLQSALDSRELPSRIRQISSIAHCFRTAAVADFEIRL